MSRPRYFDAYPNLAELAYEQRSNTKFMMLMAVFLLPASSLGVPALVGGSTARGPDAGQALAQWLVVVLVISLYWNGAYLKLRSPHFRSGLLLQQVAEVQTVLRSRWGFRESPGWIWRFASSAAGTQQRWMTVSLAVIVIEVLLPLMLLFDRAHIAGIALGVVLHATFTVIHTRVIAGFSIATVGSYPCFLAPVI